MDDQEIFSVGQVVKLNSGGPEMTIRSINENDHGQIKSYSCQWFAGKKLEQGVFPPESLKMIETN